MTWIEKLSCLMGMHEYFNSDLKVEERNGEYVFSIVCSRCGKELIRNFDPKELGIKEKN